MSESSSTNSPFRTGLDVRLAARNKSLTAQTSGLAPSYLQANLIVLPSRYAPDFRLLCHRNPVPCPLLAESASPGDFSTLKTCLPAAAESEGIGMLQVVKDVDLRHDFPRYRVYQDGKLVAEKADAAMEWTDDHVGFLIGCSFSFEAALAEAGLAPRHMVQGRNVPMYRTDLLLCSAGVFAGATSVVSMRPYAAADIERVRAITRRFAATHGEPVAWGWDAADALGIADIACPEWGEPPLRAADVEPFTEADNDGYVPVFWGCGVTPQNAVMAAGLDGVVVAHAPGHMLVLDLQDHEVFPPVAEQTAVSLVP